MEKMKRLINEYSGLKVLYIIFTFALLDVWLRVMTRWIGAYSIYELPPNLFTIFWSLLITTIILMIRKQLIARIIYGVLYYLFALYSIVQYGYYLIFGKFLYFNDFILVNEGADFKKIIWDILDVNFVISIIILILVGVVGIKIFPMISKKRRLFMGYGISAVCIVGICLTPMLYGDITGEWDAFKKPAYEYRKFVNSAYDMELTGIYQYIARDIQQIMTDGADDEIYEELDAYFQKKEEHIENLMTGVYKEKNIIVVMMESMDDWLITPEDTPTIYDMMEKGIRFSNFYTPDFASGYTFNTEFAFNTSVYPFSNGTTACSLTENDFRNSLANLFSREGYCVNSYHEGEPNFYNRGAMHDTFGYEKYHSYREYSQEDISILDDSFLWECDELYEDLIGYKKQPFMSFVITFSPHLPYDMEDEVSRIALEKYPQYIKKDISQEHILRAKAHLTDDMFLGLLKRLEEDGILEDTVIVGFADHYAYGMKDKERLLELSKQAGSSILEKTPAFIYCAGDERNLSVDKVMQTTDLTPTIANMFGLKVPKEVMGSDIFDENYVGYALFPNYTWIMDGTYVKNGGVVWNDHMSEEQIRDMNQFVQKTYEINDWILEGDYYKYLSDNS